MKLFILLAVIGSSSAFVVIPPSKIHHPHSNFHSSVELYEKNPLSEIPKAAVTFALTTAAFFMNPDVMAANNNNYNIMSPAYAATAAVGDLASAKTVLTQAQNEYKSAGNALKNAKKELKSAQEKVKSVEEKVAKNKQSYKKAKDNLATKGKTEAQVDRLTGEVDKALSNLDNSKVELDAAKDLVKAKKAAVDGSQAMNQSKYGAVSNAEKDLKKVEARIVTEKEKVSDYDNMICHYLIEL